MAKPPKEPTIRICVSLPASLVERVRIDAGKQSMSSRAVELIETGLAIQNKIVIQQRVVIRPGTLRYTPLPAQTKTPNVAATSWGPAAGNTGPAVNLEEYQDGKFISKMVQVRHKK